METTQEDNTAAGKPLPTDTQPETPKVNPTVAEAKDVVARMAAENDRAEGILVRQEQLAAERIVSGHADAGQVAEKPKEETPKEYSERIMRGDLKDGEGKQD